MTIVKVTMNWGRVHLLVRFSWLHMASPGDLKPQLFLDRIVGGD